MTLDDNTPSVLGAPPPGEMLRQARDAAGLTQEDIAAKLKLAPRQVAAIEAGDWSALPERTFTRGFMRNYARLVGLDPDSLGLDQSSSQLNVASQLKPTPEAIGEIARDADRNGFGAARWLVPLLLIAALATGVLYFQGERWFGWDMSRLFSTTATPSLQSAVAAKAATATVTAPATASALPAAAAPSEASATSSGAVIAPANAAAPSPATEATAATSSASPAASLVPAVAATDDKRISITFKGKSWTEVRSKGDVIFSETATPGVREFTGTPPLSFTVGNASNVSVLIDGKPFDMTDLTRNDVARFRVE